MCYSQDMKWLALSAICSLVIANILRYARQHDLPFLPIMTINYLQAALVSFVLNPCSNLHNSEISID